MSEQDQQQSELVELFGTKQPRYQDRTMPVDELPADPFTKAPTWMVEALKQEGMIYPIIVADMGDEGYRIVDGRRRLATARKVGLQTVSVRIFDSSDLPAYIAWSAKLNNERAPNPVTDFEAVQTLSLAGYDEAAISKSTGLTLPQIRGKQTLMGLPDEIIGALRAGEVKESVARKIARLPRPSQDALVAILGEKGGLTGKDVEPFLGPVGEQPSLFADDQTAGWTGLASATLHELLATMPDTISSSVAENLRQATSFLRTGLPSHDTKESLN